MWIINSAWYINSYPGISLIENPLNKYDKHTMLIQSIKDVLSENKMYRFIHTLHEDNQNGYCMAKLGTCVNIYLLIHLSTSSGLSIILTYDATRTLFLII